MPSTSYRDQYDDPRPNPQRRRWWHWFTWAQFSTRSLLLLVVIASFGSLYLRHTLRATRQKEGLARLAKSASVVAAERNGVVVELRLRFSSTLTPSDFDGIELLDDLEQLIIEVDDLAPHALEPIVHRHGLSELELIGKLPDLSLARLPANLPVSSFAINRTSWDSPKEAIRTVTRWPGLRKFTLQGIGEDPTLLEVASPENAIRELSLVGGFLSTQSAASSTIPSVKTASGMEEIHLYQLANWRSLRSLQLLRLKLRNQVDSPSLAKLERLSIAHCDAAASTLDGLVGLPELRFIRLWNCVAKPRQIGIALAGPKLSEFELLALDANGATLNGLSNTKSLQRLTLSLNLVDDTMLRSLAACSTIKEVELVNLAGEKTLPNLKRVRQVEEEIERILEKR